MTEPLQETCFVGSNCSSIDGMKRFSHEAMATTFELLIVHEDELYARQAATAAFETVDRLEDELSRFRENSEVTRINNLPANQSLRLGLDTFECLKIARRIYAQTNGAFDITIGTLLKCWRNDDGSPRKPSPKEVDLARLHTGTNLLQLNEAEHTISLSVSGVQVDLGGIGKGYAVDCVAELLRDWSIDVALISGGYSSVLALDAPPGKKGRQGTACAGWPLTMTNPFGDKEILVRPFLQNAALSGSGVQKGGHIIDPRSSQPVESRCAAWSSAPDATTADALSTAFMIMGIDEIEKYCTEHPDTLGMVILEDGAPRGVPHYGDGEKGTPFCERSAKWESKQFQQKIMHFGDWEKVLSSKL